MGVAKSRYEPLTEPFESSLRISKNHIVIQQHQKTLRQKLSGSEIYRLIKTIFSGANNDNPVHQISWAWQ